MCLVPSLLGSAPPSTTADGSDDEIVVADIQRVGLRCPLSRLRIVEPARGRGCKHVGCFDLTTYLQFNRRNKKWNCPLWYDDVSCTANIHRILTARCYKCMYTTPTRMYTCSHRPAPIRDLVIDTFMRRVLTTLPTADEVLVRSDGTFTVAAGAGAGGGGGGGGGGSGVGVGGEGTEDGDGEDVQPGASEGRLVLLFSLHVSKHVLSRSVSVVLCVPCSFAAVPLDLTLNTDDEPPAPPAYDPTVNWTEKFIALKTVRGVLFEYLGSWVAG